MLNNKEYTYLLTHLMSISLSIYGIYIAPLQGNYSEVLPARPWWKERS